MLKFQILRLAFVVILFLLALLSLWQKLPAVFETGFYAVETGSMAPDINPGDVVIIQRADSYALNDVITFKLPVDMNTLITHRILKTETDEGRFFYRTKGDKNSDLDPWQIYPDLILGKVVFVVPYLGNLIKFLKMPLVLIIFLIFPTLALMAWELRIIFDKKVLNKIDQLYQKILKTINSGFNNEEKLEA